MLLDFNEFMCMYDQLSILSVICSISFLTLDLELFILFQGVGMIFQITLIGRRPDVLEDERQEHKSVETSKEDDEEIHPKVVELEDGGGSEGKHYHTNELGGSDTYQHATSHLSKSFPGSGLFGALLSHEAHAHMVAELYSQTQTGDQVHHQDSIHLNRIPSQDQVEHPHCTHELKHNQEDTESYNESDTQTVEHL